MVVVSSVVLGKKKQQNKTKTRQHTEQAVRAQAVLSPVFVNVLFTTTTLAQKKKKTQPRLAPVFFSCSPVSARAYNTDTKTTALATGGVRYIQCGM